MAELKDQLVTLEVLKYSKDTLNNKINMIGNVSNNKLTLGNSNASQCVLNIGGINRLLTFNPDGTITWQSV